MRVLITTDTVGGVWTFTQELASGLLERGCDLALFSLGRAPSPEQHAWCHAIKKRWGERFCFKSTDVPLEWMQQNARALSQAVLLLLRLMEDFQPDLLHSNQFCFGALPVSLPIVITAHSDVLSWAANCREAPLEDSAWLRQYISLVQEGLVGAHAVVAPTRWMLNALGCNFELPATQFVIPNGRQVSPGKLGHRKLQAVTAGRLWDEAKNLLALSAVESECPLLIAGETSFAGLAAPTTDPTARFIGALSQPALHALFRESAIYVCPSQYEPFGLAPLEAALCGCAVVANDIPSLREVWADGALYFNDFTGLSHLLAALHADPELLKRAQHRSFERAVRYTRNAMASAYLATYRELVSRKGELYDVA